ncbi:MAG: RNA methyltransferase [Bacteroidales bacterium]|jgi:TrmH family RNA methyltransferase|nr:RNA methyltransferase [Bacteroidales bacterium]
MTQKLSKAKISLIKSLSIKKYRQEHRLFIAEGTKIVNEILKSNLKIRYLIRTEDWAFNKTSIDFEDIITAENEINKISNLKTTSHVIAIAEIPDYNLNISFLKNKLTVVIDNIQDPGNLGTIIRICDWFGIENIICSNGSVDIYNPKAIQATMGSFLRVKVFYEDLQNFIKEYKNITGNCCYGTFLEGENIYKIPEKDNGLIVFGNEGQGISKEIEKIVDKKIMIPPFNENSEHSESLNISTATAIICSEFRRTQ